jgi:hypothetical protein
LELALRLPTTAPRSAAQANPIAPLLVFTEVDDLLEALKRTFEKSNLISSDILLAVLYKLSVELVALLLKIS